SRAFQNSPSLWMSFFSATCFRTMSATPPCINASNFSGSSARAVRISLMLVGLGSRPAWVERILLSLRFMLELLSMVVFHMCTVVILSGDCSHLGDESDQGDHGHFSGTESHLLSGTYSP